MAPTALSTIIAVASASLVAAQATLTFPATPLISQSFPEPSDVPYQVFPASTPYVRGPQTGYNICNSTTEGDTSLCQTSYFNSLDDFCLWGPPTANTSIADSEGEEVAWCTQPGHGTRVIPPGTLLGAQLLINDDYWMITGLINQSQINMQADDFGGELDSGGQDERGNPIGGLMYGTAFNSDVHQINWWTEFIGSGQFCLKICNPAGNNEAGYCQHTLDRIGLGYNCPSKYTIGAGYQPGEFEVCQSDDIIVPGIYVDSAGVTQSYSQPPESLGAITTIPYQPSTAASSACTTYASTDLFAANPNLTFPTATSASAGSPPVGSAAATTTGSSTLSIITTGPATTLSHAGTANPSNPSAAGSTGNGASANSVSMGTLLAIVGSFMLMI